MGQGWSVTPFVPPLDEPAVADLRARLRRTRWPDPAPGAPWEQGTDLGYLSRLCAYWAEEFDWSAQVDNLRRYTHVRARVGGTEVHAVHAPARHGAGVPIVLTHGWPSAFTEYLPVVPLLTDPAAHGIDGPEFDVVLPSLPGYAYSPRPARPVNYRDVARLWHELMRALGYDRYAAGGGDFGAGVATLMALEDPARLMALHLSNMELAPYLGPGAVPLTAAERAYLAGAEAWWATEGGYKAIQSTRPQTLGYALNDSPAGLAAWIVEKWRAWEDPHGDLDDHARREQVLTVLTLYWVTRTITSSMRDYYDNRWRGIALGLHDHVRVPTAFAAFADPAGDPPREWVERLYDVVRWTPMARGGHFAATEAPELFARDVVGFFAEL